MNKAHDALVAGQFGPRANAYVESAVHARGEDLAALEAIVAKTAPARALDLGCGGGHVAYLLARHAARVVAVDLSADMLAAVSRTAKDKGLTNIETHRASVERLPFADASFDHVVTRYSAHHWLDFEGGLREARRVAKPGSPAIFMDVFAPGVPLLDTHLQSLELLRDTSHVRNYTLAEWSDALARAGFVLQERPHLAAASGIRKLDRPHAHAGGFGGRDPGLADGRAAGSAGSFRHRRRRLLHHRHDDAGNRRRLAGGLFHAFDEAKIPLGAIAQRGQRFLIGRAVMRGHGGGDAFEFDEDGARLDAGFVDATSLPPRARNFPPPAMMAGPAIAAYFASFVGIGDGAIGGDPIALGHVMFLSNSAALKPVPAGKASPSVASRVFIFRRSGCYCPEHGWKLLVARRVSRWIM